MAVWIEVSKVATVSQSSGYYLLRESSIVYCMDLEHFLHTDYTWSLVRTFCTLTTLGAYSPQ
jgi:hypothetical protein